MEKLQELREAKRRDLGLADGDLLVVAVGRLVAQKRPLLFLEHAAGLKKVFPAARFMWIGGENDTSFGWVGHGTSLGGESLTNQWIEKARALGLAEAAQLVPWQRDVAPFVAAADLYFHTAAYEGLPLALLEAMAAGLPPAVSPEMRSELNFLNGDNSILLAPQTDWSVLQKEDWAGRVGRNARSTIENFFSERNMAERYVSLYGKIAGSRI